MDPIALKKIRSAQALMGVVAMLAVIPIFFGCFIIWQMSDVPTVQDTENGLKRLEKKIGETYTAEMHDQFSKIVISGDEAVFTIFGAMEKGGRHMLLFGLALFCISLVSIRFIGKAFTTIGIAEQGGADQPATAPVPKPPDN